MVEYLENIHPTGSDISMMIKFNCLGMATLCMVMSKSKHNKIIQSKIIDVFPNCLKIAGFVPVMEKRLSV